MSGFVPKISCFADCGSECLVLRVPYELAVEMVASLPEGNSKEQLLHRMEIASRRSKKFHNLLSKNFPEKK